MSDIITVRDSEIIAAEINIIKEDTRRIMIANTILIGGKLVEAKSMVPYGEWGKWLEEKVNYSQSTAENMMKLYREYGEGQLNLFDNWTNSETFANLSYTQHMALLALPFSDRMEFAEKNNVESLSTRELEKAIREELAAAQAERDDIQRKLDETEKALFSAQTDLEYAQDNLDAEKTRAREVEREQKQLVEAMKSRAESAEKEKAWAEKYEQHALKQVKKLEKQLEEAKAAEAAALAEAKKAAENPEIPESLMEQLRKDAAAEAAKQAAEEVEKKLAAAEKQAQAETAAREKAEQAAKDAAEKLAEAEKAVKTANPIITEAIVRAQKLTNDFNELNGFRLKQQATAPSIAESIRKIMLDMIESMRGCIS